MVKEFPNLLQKKIRGEVRFDDGSRALYSTDASNYRQIPIGIVIPRDANDVQETINLCRQFNVPILSRGGGTSLAGQCCNTAVIMDMSKYMNQILQIDTARKMVRVLPGVILDQLKNEVEKYGLTFGPDPATHTHCTLGGMIGNNSCGIHAQMSGKTQENVEELEIITYSGLRLKVGRINEAELNAIIQQGGERGKIYQSLKNLREHYKEFIKKGFPQIPRRVSGYNLEELLEENQFP